jgi:hypothetical protein
MSRRERKKSTYVTVSDIFWDSYSEPTSDNEVAMACNTS